MTTFITTSPHDFKLALKAALMAAAPKGDVSVLQHINATRHGNNLVLHATDRYRAVRATIPGTWSDDTEINRNLPPTFAKALVRDFTAPRCLSGEAHLTIDDDGQGYSIGGLVVTSSEPYEISDYPEVARLIDSGRATSEPVDKIALNPTFFADLCTMLKPADDDTPVLQFAGKTKAVYTEFHYGDVFMQHVVMPMYQVESR